MKVEVTAHQVTIYRVVCTFRSERCWRKHFHRKGDLYKRLAWWAIADKYGDLDSPTGHTSHLPKCKCESEPGPYGLPVWTSCPLHDRALGYFARLHRRYRRRLEKSLVIGGESGQTGTT